MFRCSNMWFRTVGVYSPNDDADATVIDDFMEKLAQVLDEIGNRKEVALMGDFNGRLGKRNKDEIIGRYDENTIIMIMELG